MEISTLYIVLGFFKRKEKLCQLYWQTDKRLIKAQKWSSFMAITFWTCTCKINYMHVIKSHKTEFTALVLHGEKKQPGECIAEGKHSGSLVSYYNNWKTLNGDSKFKEFVCTDQLWVHQDPHVCKNHPAASWPVRTISSDTRPALNGHSLHSASLFTFFGIQIMYVIFQGQFFIIHGIVRLLHWWHLEKLYYTQKSAHKWYSRKVMSSK